MSEELGRESGGLSREEVYQRIGWVTQSLSESGRVAPSSQAWNFLLEQLTKEEVIAGLTTPDIAREAVNQKVTEFLGPAVKSRKPAGPSILERLKGILIRPASSQTEKPVSRRIKTNPYAVVTTAMILVAIVMVSLAVDKRADRVPQSSASVLPAATLSPESQTFEEWGKLMTAYSIYYEKHQGEEWTIFKTVQGSGGKKLSETYPDLFSLSNFLAVIEKAAIEGNQEGAKQAADVFERYMPDLRKASITPSEFVVMVVREGQPSNEPSTPGELPPLPTAVPKTADPNPADAGSSVKNSIAGAVQPGETPQAEEPTPLLTEAPTATAELTLKIQPLPTVPVFTFYIVDLFKCGFSSPVGKDKGLIRQEAYNLLYLWARTLEAKLPNPDWIENELDLAEKRGGSLDESYIKLVDLAPPQPTTTPLPTLTPALANALPPLPKPTATCPGNGVGCF